MIEDIKGQENIPNSSVLIQSLKEELNYLQNENPNKTSIIKSLTENHCVPANINSVVVPPNLHHEKVQDEKHKSSTNKSHDAPKTGGSKSESKNESRSKVQYSSKKKNTHTW